jgi:hypothetical protein
MNCGAAATNMGSAARAATTAGATSAAGAATATASHMGHQRHHPITRGLGSRSRGCGLC